MRWTLSSSSACSVRCDSIGWMLIRNHFCRDCTYTRCHPLSRLGLQGNMDMPAWLVNPDYERPGWVRWSAIDKSHWAVNTAVQPWGKRVWPSEAADT